MTFPISPDLSLATEQEILIPPHDEIVANFQEKEKLRKLMYGNWVPGVVNYQRRLAHDIPDIYRELAYPEQVTSDFYRQYFEAFGQDEEEQTIDTRQLGQRVINNPSYLEKVNSLGVLRASLIGCASGMKNIEEVIIKDMVRRRNRGQTQFVGIEPYPPQIHNPLIKPYYSVRLEDLANDPRERGQSDIATMFGSSRMDILLILDRLDSTLALNSILKKGGIAIIDEAVPPSALPDLGGQSLKDITSYTQESNLAEATGAHDLDLPGFFRRTWKDKNGKEFGKLFYAEPLEQYFFFMQEFGFTPLLTNYDELKAMLQNPALHKPWSRVKQVLSQRFPPNRRDLSDQIFYQSTEGVWRKHLRYVMFWQKTGEPNPEMLTLMQNLHGQNLFEGKVE